MVRPGHCPNHTSHPGPVLRGGLAGKPVADIAIPAGAAGGLVSQGLCNLLRYHCPGATMVMARRSFIDLRKTTRHDGNPDGFVSAPDGYAELRGLNGQSPAFGEAKEVGRPPGRTPGLVMTAVRCRWVTRRKAS